MNKSAMFSRYMSYAVLKMYVNDTDSDLYELYKTAVEKHNKSLLTDDFPNSGFDVFVPSDFTFKGEEQFKSQFISMNIKCEMSNYFTSDEQFFKIREQLNEHDEVNIKYTTKSCAFDLMPRSSISKTPLMLANHVGLIDSGYRGWIIGAFRSFSNEDYVVEKHTRLLQICHPTRCPIFVEIVKEEELSNTSRGEGGFGSTGNIGV